jgi:allophanate hydrolase subunit 2
LVIEAGRPLVVATGWSRSTLATGERVAVEPAEDQMWAYLAVRGGLDVQPVLGSRCHDTLSGLGPAPIADGVELPIGADPGTNLPADHAPVRRRSGPVRLWPGPRRDQIVDPLGVLSRRTWTVSTSVSRIGVRLGAGPFAAVSVHHLASEGLVPGAIQITPAGEPIVMLANHPTTGGYPVVAVVDPDDLQLVAQARPGATLRFVLNPTR